MNAWGAQAFESSVAEAWLDALDERHLVSRVGATLELAELERGLSLSESVALVCAAEIVAARRGQAAPRLPDELRQQLVLALRPSARELELARTGAARVLEESPLRAYWEARGELAAWATVLRDLRVRLES